MMVFFFCVLKKNMNVCVGFELCMALTFTCVLNK